MNDRSTTVEELKKMLADMVAEREWEQFHTPKNLVMSLSVEANELMELFLWRSEQASHELCESKKTEIAHELADVVMNCLLISRAANIDLAAAVESKIGLIKQKYPVEKARGNPAKYTEL